MCAESFVFEAGEEAVEESVDDEAAGFVAGDSSGCHVEEFVLADGAVGGSVAAADFVVQDFETGHGVGVGVVAEDEVFDLLVGVRALGAGFDFDQSCEDRAGFVVEGVEVEEVAGGVRGDMILQGALIDLAGSFDGIEGEHLATGAFADEEAEAFATHESPAAICDEGGAGRIAVHRSRIQMEGGRIEGPVLDGDIGEFGSGGEVEIVDSAGEGCVFVGGLEVVQHRDAAVLSADDERVREDRGVGTFDPLENFDGKLDACVGWHK